MSELRRDPVLGYWVIINEKRADRPRQLKKIETIHNHENCYFCPGNESLTPPEIGRVEEKGQWKLRWFENKFPIVNHAVQFYAQKKEFQGSPGFGYHEVVVDTNDHKRQMWDLSVKALHQLLKVYALRTSELSKLRNVQCVSIFKNHGVEGGTSIIHSHTQIITLPFIPPRVSAEVHAHRKHGACAYCTVIRKEQKSRRFVFRNNSFIAFCPYASRFNYEVWIFSRKHVSSLLDFNDRMLKDLAEILRLVLSRLRVIGCSYNFFLHYDQKGKLHFHIEVTPRKATWAGFEIGTDIIVNSVSPETAAKFYRGEG